MNTRDKLIEIYLDWVNNYISIEKFAEHNILHKDEAITLLSLGSELLYTDRPEK